MAYTVPYLLFKVLDRNEDGFLTPEDLCEYSEEFLKFACTIDSCQLLLSHVFGTHEVDISTFTKQNLDIFFQNLDVSIEAMFQIFEPNRENKISQSRIFEWLAKHEVEPNTLVIGDDLITFEEFRKLILSSSDNIRTEFAISEYL